MTVTFQGNPLTLKGRQLQVGDKMPEFTLIDNGLGTVNSNDLTGLKVFLAVPSLDTPVCDLEVRNFNQKASELSGVHIYAVSMDLPFAQARWCGANGIDNVKTLSDYKGHSFGEATGTVIEELALLTRAVFVVDDKGMIRHVEYVSEITNHPDYDAAYAKITGKG